MSSNEASRPGRPDRPGRSAGAGAVVPGFDEASARPGTSLVPRQSIAGRSLVTIVAIMTFLAAIAAGAVLLVARASAEWRAQVAQEMTIQVRPQAARDTQSDVDRVVQMARAVPGIAEVRPFSRAESERLLEPWLGSGLGLDELPVPRVIVLRLADGARIDIAALRERLATIGPGISADDHRVWIDRLRTMANTVVVAGFAIVGLVLIATALAVGFATRGAMAGNRDIVEVLHFVGAENRFIVREFGRHFLRLGAQGGAIGGGAAILLLWIAGIVAARLRATPGGDQLEAMFGTFEIGWGGILAIAMIALVVAGVTVLASTRTVAAQLGRLLA